MSDHDCCDIHLFGSGNNSLKKHCTKSETLRAERKGRSQTRVLKRIAKWHPREGITFEADLRHAETIRRDTEAENLNTISTPAAKETERETEEEKRQYLKERSVSGKLGSKMNDDDKDEALSADAATRYGRIAARANFLAQDRMDNRVCYGGSSEANDSTHD